MHWASSISTKGVLSTALAECEESIRSQLGDAEPDLVIVFAQPLYDQQSRSLSADVRGRFPSATVIGCTGMGIIGAGKESERIPALSITAAELPGVHVSPFHLNDSELPSPDAPPDAWETKVGVTQADEPHFILLADPFSISGENLIAGLDFAFPSAAKIGGLASGGSRPGSHGMYYNEMVMRTGVVGVALSGNLVVDTVVAQGCRPVGEPMRVTSADHNMLLTTDDEKPIEALQRIFERSTERDRGLMQRNLFMGIAMDPLVDDARQGDFLIRNILGVDPDSGAVAIGAELREGQLVQFHVRDADTSDEDLRSALSSYVDGIGGRQAAGALMFQCTGRGQYLYGDEGHDAGVFKELVGRLPLGGFFCNGEIGPVGGSTYLHGYTSSFAIFRERTMAG